MAKINSSSFGSITIDGKTYNHDVYILASGKVEEREHGHTFSKEQVEHILKDYNPPSASSRLPEGKRAPNPDVVVIGKGTSGMANLSEDGRTLLEEKEIEIIEDNTPDIKDKFNELSETKKVAAIIHVTC